jgi:hypothetical protein
MAENQEYMFIKVFHSLDNKKEIVDIHRNQFYSKDVNNQNIIGGWNNFREINEEENEIFKSLEIKELNHLKSNEKLGNPVKIKSQVVAGVNYLFLVEIEDTNFVPFESE